MYLITKKCKKCQNRQFAVYKTVLIELSPFSNGKMTIKQLFCEIDTCNHNKNKKINKERLATWQEIV